MGDMTFPQRPLDDSDETNTAVQVLKDSQPGGCMAELNVPAMEFIRRLTPSMWSRHKRLGQTSICKMSDTNTRAMALTQSPNTCTNAPTSPTDVPIRKKV